MVSPRAPGLYWQAGRLAIGNAVITAGSSVLCAKTQGGDSLRLLAASQVRCERVGRGVGNIAAVEKRGGLRWLGVLQYLECVPVSRAPPWGAGRSCCPLCRKYSMSQLRLCCMAM